MRSPSVSGFRRRFQRLFRIRGQVAHVLLTLPPLGARGRPVRLACLIHAASVHSEPGSNSPSQKWKGCPGKPRAWPVLLSISLRGLSPSQRQGGSFRSLHKQSHHIALLDFQRTAPTSRANRKNRRIVKLNPKRAFASNRGKLFRLFLPRSRSETKPDFCDGLINYTANTLLQANQSLFLRFFLIIRKVLILPGEFADHLSRNLV
jgi:hypothetical protein